MKTPSYWQTENLLSRILSPISWIYGRITQYRLNHASPYHCKAKVICIGNITAGGVGKTPVSLALAEQYQKSGKKVFFLTRGYKGKLKNIVVDLNNHTAEETGDEARLLANTAPTIISPNRAEGAKLAEKAGAEIVIMDDGFQNPGLYKDESWLVFDGGIGIGNGRIIPSGPLRETLANGLKRADKILIMGEDKTNLASQISSLPIYQGKVIPEPLTLKNKKVLAFAGIGHPQKFYRTLRDIGCEVILTQDFPDHYQYKDTDIADLISRAKAQNLALVTTEKDFVKLSDKQKKNINVLKIKASWKLLKK